MVNKNYKILQYYEFDGEPIWSLHVEGFHVSSHCILRIESCGQFFFLARIAMPSLVGGPWHSYYPCYPTISKFCSNYNDRLSTNITFMSTFCTSCVFAHITNIFTKHIFKLIWHCLHHVLGEKLCQIYIIKEVHNIVG